MSEMTTLYLLPNIRLNNKYEHSIHFDTIAEQKAYFDERVELTRSSYAFIRRSWELKIDVPYGLAQFYNYLFFEQNSKRYYYFINSAEYVSDDVTKLDIELDVIQTYMFDWDLLPCFIERQHTKSDEIGEHTVEENLECGELINAGEVNFIQGSDLVLLVFSTIDIDNSISTEKPYYTMRSTYDHVYCGANIYAVQESDFKAFSLKLEQLSSLGMIDAIISLHMYPKDLVKLSPSVSWNDTNVLKDVIGANYIEVDVEKSVVNRGYEPRNNKLKCYPYNMLYISNNNGNGGVFRFERFNNPDNIQFKIIGGLTQDSGAKIIPYAYNNVANQYNDEAGVLLNGYPSCTWNSDTYKVWLAQNQNQHALTVQDANVKAAVSIGSGVAGLIGSVATANVNGAVASVAGGTMGVYGSYMQVQGLVAQQRDMAITPPQSKGSFSPALNVANGLQGFSAIYKRVTDEFCKILDDYFTMYGYKINRIQKPSLHNRRYYTFIKTVGCAIKGDINNNDRVQIETIFNKGLTFWRVDTGIDVGEYGYEYTDGEFILYNNKCL